MCIAAQRNVACGISCIPIRIYRSSCRVGLVILCRLYHYVILYVYLDVVQVYINLHMQAKKNVINITSISLSKIIVFPTVLGVPV